MTKQKIAKDNPYLMTFKRSHREMTEHSKELLDNENNAYYKYIIDYLKDNNLEYLELELFNRDLEIRDYIIVLEHKVANVNIITSLARSLDLLESNIKVLDLTYVNNYTRNNRLYKALQSIIAESLFNDQIYSLYHFSHKLNNLENLRII